jgi:hypothetical protein
LSARVWIAADRLDAVAGKGVDGVGDRGSVGMGVSGDAATVRGLERGSSEPTVLNSVAAPVDTASNATVVAATRDRGRKRRTSADSARRTSRLPIDGFGADPRRRASVCGVRRQVPGSRREADGRRRSNRFRVG